MWPFYTKGNLRSFTTSLAITLHSWSNPQILNCNDAILFFNPKIGPSQFAWARTCRIKYPNEKK